MATSSSEKYIIGGFLGGAVGLAFGILLAPRSGKEMREIIRDEVEARSHRTADLLKEKTDAIRHKANILKEGLVNVSSELEEKEKVTQSNLKTSSNKVSEAP